MFERVNKAYEFLCSRTKVTEGPDPQNIVLILKAQSILFSRYKESKWSKICTDNNVTTVLITFLYTLKKNPIF